MPRELSKRFEPAPAEAKWYKAWQELGIFEADSRSDKPPYCIVIPPPNVTARLHAGHALGMTIQDLLTRWKRMAGFESLYLPGTDHAGIATQTVVEKHLMQTEGRRRTEFSREEFLERVWEWKEEYQTNIDDQMRALGLGVDWSRYAFTLDEQRSKAVLTAFKKLYDDGLIYRGNYIVNWDPVSGTALADDEVEYSEVEGQLWNLKYPIEDEPGRFATVATTRPETMLGDTAVAVNPADERYKDLVGRRAILPLLDRAIPIVADDFVDPAFGTGMVKVTPAHDPDDFQCGQRHNLPQINVMTTDARINEHGGPYVGLTRFAARERIVEDLQVRGLIHRVEKHRHRVGKSYRSGAIVEPYLSKQWFVRIKPLAELAAKAVRDADQESGVFLIPRHWEATYFHWMDNVRDWCISRQLWWGHRIPVFRHAETAEEVCTADGKPPDSSGRWQQDNDVLDTWFSSWLWPFSTLGWPWKEGDDPPRDLQKFYPTSVLVTGHDILFFWVARMIMAGLYFLEERPFRDVYLTGLIFGQSFFRERDGMTLYLTGEERARCEAGDVPADVQSRWEKMSKSKGNILDPLDMVREYGCDSVRLALLAYCAQGRNIDLDRNRLEGYRNFSNKLWNAARLIWDRVGALAAEDYFRPLTPGERASRPVEDRWILSRFAEAAGRVDAALKACEFDVAMQTLYHFIWGEFCDWYLEFSKARTFDDSTDVARLSANQARSTLVSVLEHTVRLLAPACPFISEEIWQTLRTQFTGESLRHYPAFAAPSIHTATWPGDQPLVSDWRDAVAERQVGELREFVHVVRNIRGEMRIPPSEAVVVHVASRDPGALARLLTQTPLAGRCTRIERIVFDEADRDLDGIHSRAVAGPFVVQVPLPGSMLEAERSRMAREQTRLVGEIVRQRSRVTNENFLAKAPPEVVQKEREKLASLEAAADELARQVGPG